MPPASPEMVRAACNVAEWANDRLGQHGGRAFHNIAPVEIRQHAYPIRGDETAGAFFPARGLDAKEVTLAFVVGAARGGNGWHYPPDRGIASISAYVLETAMRWPDARDDKQRHQIESDATLIVVHELAHAAYGLRHPVPRHELTGPAALTHITAYMTRATWRALPAGEGFDDDERRQIAEQTWLKAAPMVAPAPSRAPPRASAPPRAPPRVSWLDRLAAWIRRRPPPPPVFNFGGPAFRRAPVLARHLIARHFPVEEWENAAAIGERESNWRTSVVSDTVGNTDLPPGHLQELSVGWFQINVLEHREYAIYQMKDPEQNVAAAAAIWKVEGWGAWLLSASALGLV